MDTVNNRGTELVVNAHIESTQVDYPYVIALGMAFGIASTILFNKFPDRFESALHNATFTGDQIVALVLAFSGITSIPVGILVEKIGSSLSSQIGILGVFIVMFAMLLLDNVRGAILCTILFAMFKH